MPENPIKLVIQGRLEDHNKYITAQRTNVYAGAKIKRQQEDYISVFIKNQLKNIEFKNQVDIEFNWYEKNKRRDKDNIEFAKKFIFDALVKCGKLKDDGWKEIGNLSSNFYVDKDKPRIEIFIKESEAI